MKTERGMGVARSFICNNFDLKTPRNPPNHFLFRFGCLLQDYVQAFQVSSFFYNKLNVHQTIF